MKKEPGNRIKLGVFVFIGLALLLVGIYFIGSRQQMFTETFRISAVFNDVNGLQVGNNVRFSGINVGSVEMIEIITDTTVKVDMTIEEEVRKFIKKDAKAIITSDGLMGNKIMNITPGTPTQPVISNNDMIATNKPVSIEDILNKVKQTTDLSAQIATDLAAIIGNIRSGRGTIGKLFMDSALASNLNKTLVNARQGAKSFKDNMDAAQHNILLRGYFKKKEKEELKKTKREKREEEKRLKKEQKDLEKQAEENDPEKKERKGLLKLFKK